MTGKTHVGMGVAVGIALSDKIPGGFQMLGMFILIMSSIMPDIDHPKSIVNKYVLPFRNKNAKIFIYASAGIGILSFNYRNGNQPTFIVLGLAFILAAFSSHRNGLTHSLFGMALFSFAFVFLGSKYNMKFIVYYFMIGYGSHLICDMFTNRGVPLFYPFKKKKMKFPVTFRVGSSVGKGIEEMLVIIALIYVIYKLPSL